MSRVETFKAWRLSEAGLRKEATPIEIGEVDGLPEAVGTAQERGCFAHKDVMIVLHENAATQARFAHFYAIRQKSTPSRVWNAGAGKYDLIKPLYAAPVFTMAVEAFEPKEPWQWTPDADVVGADRNTIKQG